MPTISTYKRQRIIDLRNEGISLRNIANQLDVSRGGVESVLKRWTDGHGVTNRTKNHCRKKLSNRTERRLVIMSKRNPRMTANQLRFATNTEHVSVDTVKRTLRRFGQMGRIAIKKPGLNRRQKALRMAFARNCSNWSVNDWSKVIFSDESKIELKPFCREYVRRNVRDNKFGPQFITPTQKFSKSLMIWGAVRSDGTKTLVRCLKSVDQTEYQRILDEGLPRVYSSRFKFQQDGASCHTARSTSEYLTRKEIRMLPFKWPPQSPDLSLIENVWDNLKERVLLRKPNNLDDLWQCCLQEWSKITLQDIQNLYESMPRRVKAVLDAKGGNTKY